MNQTSAGKAPKEEHEEFNAEQRCRRCGEWIKRGRAVWVNGQPYGRDCAKAVSEMPDSDRLNCGDAGEPQRDCGHGRNSPSSPAKLSNLLSATLDDERLILRFPEGGEGMHLQSGMAAHQIVHNLHSLAFAIERRKAHSPSSVSGVNQ